LSSAFRELGDRIIYWNVDDVELVARSKALAIIDELVEELVTYDGKRNFRG
jgi:hypothetical protein